MQNRVIHPSDDVFDSAGSYVPTAVSYVRDIVYSSTINNHDILLCVTGSQNKPQK